MWEIETDNEGYTTDGGEAGEPAVTPWLSRWAVGSAGLSRDVHTGGIRVVSHTEGYGVAQTIGDRLSKRLADLVAEDKSGCRCGGRGDKKR